MTDLIDCFEEFIDEAEIETKCDNCDETFIIQLNISAKYNTYVDEEGS